MKDRKEIPKFRPINKDAANFLKPLVDYRLTDEEKKHRQATTAIEMGCPKSLRALYKYNDKLLSFCKGQIDDLDPDIKMLNKSPFPETQRVMKNCRIIRAKNSRRKKICMLDLERFFYGNKDPEVIPYDENFFNNKLILRGKKKFKRKRNESY